MTFIVKRESCENVKRSLLRGDESTELVERLMRQRWLRNRSRSSWLCCFAFHEHLWAKQKSQAVMMRKFHGKSNCLCTLGNLMWGDFSIDPREMRVDSFPRTQLINGAGCDFLWLRLHDGFRRRILLTGIYYKFLARTFLLWRALTGVEDNNFGRNYPSQSVGWVTFYWRLSISRVLARKLISCRKKLAK